LAAGNPQVVKLTEKAMNGEVALDEVYARRLEIIRPPRTAVDALAERYLQSMTPGAVETVRTLRVAGCIVHLVTAGIEQALAPLAARLGVTLHAVRLRFSASGEFEDFDRRSPLTRS